MLNSTQLNSTQLNSTQHFLITILILFSFDIHASNLKQFFPECSGGESFVFYTGATGYVYSNGGERNTDRFCKYAGILASTGSMDTASINGNYTCGPNKRCLSGNCVAEPSAYVSGDTIAFITTNNAPPNFGNRTNANTFCNNNKPAGLTCSNMRALVSYSGDPFNANPTGINLSKPVWWFKAGPVYTLASLNWDQFINVTTATNTAVNFANTQLTGTDYNSYVWQGTETMNCTGWTVNNGGILDAHYANTTFASSQQYCSGGYRLRCICN